MLDKSKPQGSLRPSTQGAIQSGNNNSTPALRESKSRHDKGMELYKSGRVSISSNGLFKVSGYYEADIERMSCTCPDYRTRKEACKHLFAAMLFVKNRGKQVIEDLPGTGNTDVTTKPAEVSPQTDTAPTKPFDRQSTITRLAVLNTAVELLKTHRTPLEPETVISVAAQLEAWALGGQQP